MVAHSTSVRSLGYRRPSSLYFSRSSAVHMLISLPGSPTVADGFQSNRLSKEQAYRMIDSAPRGTIFYRIVVSPDPRAEDRYRDLTLAELTTDTLLALEERLGRQVQFVAAVHDDHSPNRHVHTLVLVHRRLTRADFRALRTGATRNARLQRHLCDLARARSRLRHQTRRTRHLA